MKRILGTILLTTFFSLFTVFLAESFMTYPQEEEVRESRFRCADNNSKTLLVKQERLKQQLRTWMKREK